MLFEQFVVSQFDGSERRFKALPFLFALALYKGADEHEHFFRAAYAYPLLRVHRLRAAEMVDARHATELRAVV